MIFSMYNRFIGTKSTKKTEMYLNVYTYTATQFKGVDNAYLWCKDGWYWARNCRCGSSYSRLHLRRRRFQLDNPCTSPRAYGPCPNCLEWIFDRFAWVLYGIQMGEKESMDKKKIKEERKNERKRQNEKTLVSSRSQY